MADEEWTTPLEEKVTLESERPRLLNAVRHVESRGNPNATSPAGAEGPYQFMPATSRALGIKNPRDETESRKAADAYITRLTNMFGGDEDLGLLAYYWGPGNVQAFLRTGKGMNGQPIPKEAMEYVGKVRAAQRGQPDTPADGGFTTPASEMVKPGSLRQAAVPEKSEAQLRAEKVFQEMPAWQQALVASGKAFHDIGVNLGLADKTEEDIDKATSSTTAGFLGNLGTEALLTAIPGERAYSLALRGARALPRIGEATTLGARAIRSAIGGAAAGATGEGIMRGDPMSGAAYGAILGPVGEGIVSGAGSAYRAGKQMFSSAEDKLGTMLREAMGTPRAQQFVTALRELKNQPTLPGETLTVGHAASEALPEAKVIEEIAKRSPGANRLLEIEAANQAARAAPLENIAAPARPGVAHQGGTVPESTAEVIRTQQTKPIYRQAEPDRVEIPPHVEAMMEGPEAVAAVRAGRDKFAQHQAEVFNEGRIPPPRATPYDPDTGKFADYSIAELQFIKNELSGRISRAAQGGDTETAHQLNEVRKAVVGEMQSQSPTYAHATSQYRTLSEPVNQGQIAQKLLDALNSPSGQERSAAFIKALREAPQTIRKALGDTRFKQIEQVMTAPQMADINAVRTSLEREARYANLPAPEGILRKVENIPEQLRKNLPPVFSVVATTVRAGLKNIGIKGKQEIMDTMNEVVTNPERLASILERLPVHERGKFANAVRQLARSQRTPGYTIGAITGQINEETE